MDTMEQAPRTQAAPQETSLSADTPDTRLTDRLEKYESRHTYSSPTGTEYVLEKMSRGSYEIRSPKFGDEKLFRIETYIDKDGWGEVNNIKPRPLNGFNYQGEGLGAFIYDSYEKDLRAVGARGLRPSFGYLSPYAQSFWKKRAAERFGTVAPSVLEEMLGYNNHSLKNRRELAARIRRSQEWWESLPHA